MATGGAPRRARSSPSDVKPLGDLRAALTASPTNLADIQCRAAALYDSEIITECLKILAPRLEFYKEMRLREDIAQTILNLERTRSRKRHPRAVVKAQLFRLSKTLTDAAIILDDLDSFSTEGLFIEAVREARWGRRPSTTVPDPGLDAALKRRKEFSATLRATARRALSNTGVRDLDTIELTTKLWAAMDAYQLIRRAGHRPTLTPEGQFKKLALALYEAATGEPIESLEYQCRKIFDLFEAGQNL